MLTMCLVFVDANLVETASIKGEIRFNCVTIFEGGSSLPESGELRTRFSRLSSHELDSGDIRCGVPKKIWQVQVALVDITETQKNGRLTIRLHCWAIAW